MSKDSAVLWSWLVKRNVRNEIYSPDPLGVRLTQLRFWKLEILSIRK
jgi:hypothetical protein